MKYQPVSVTDAIKIDGQLVDLITKFHCITSMKKYEAKTIEELRFEDFLARRPGAGRVNNINTAAIASSPPASNPFGGFGVSPFGDRRTNFFGQPVHQSTPKGTNVFNFLKKNVMSTMPDTASSHEAMMTTETLNENISWTKKFFTTVSNSVGSEFGVILLILLVTTSICLQVSFCHIRTIICSISVIYSSCNVQQILQLILCVYISGAEIQQDCSSNRKSAPTMDTLYSNIATIVTVLLGIAIPTIKLSINRPRSS